MSIDLRYLRPRLKASPLLRDLTFAANCTETSGSLIDQLGGTALPEHEGPIGSTAAWGNLGNARTVTTSNQSFVASSGSDGRFKFNGESFTLACWAKPTAVGIASVLMKEFNYTAANMDYYIQGHDHATSRAVKFAYKADNPGIVEVTDGSPADPLWVAGATCCIVAWVDVAAAQIGLQVNDRAPVLSSFVAARAAMGNEPFAVGDESQHFGRGMKGDIAQVSVARRAWTAGERALYYNNGVGRLWPF